MRPIVWIVVGWFGNSLLAALGLRLAPSYVEPSLAVVIVTFLALRREPLLLAVISVAIGYGVGRLDLAPTGLNECALLLTGLGVYVVSGQLAGTGAIFTAFVSGGALVGYHLLLLLFLQVFRGQAEFSSWATALLFPSAMATSILSLLTYRPMLWLDQVLSPSRREGLDWR
ncbi:MAG: hypothetical protein R3C68_01425 [Myxococcota bacterium]